MSYKAVARQILSGILKFMWAQNIKDEDILMMDTNLISSKWDDKRPDVIYRITLRNPNRFVYVLIEHQSTVDRSILRRFLNYIHILCQHIWKTGEMKTLNPWELPVFIPIVLYNGTDEWNVPNVLREMDAQETSEGSGLSLRSHSIVVHGIPTEELLRAGGVSAAVMYVDQQSAKVLVDPELNGKMWETIRNMLKNELSELRRLFARIASDIFGIKINQKKFERYIMGKEEKPMRGTKLDEIREYGREEGRTEGRTEGRQEGIRETARGMFSIGLSADDVREVTGLSDAELRELSQTG